MKHLVPGGTSLGLAERQRLFHLWKSRFRWNS